MVARTTNSSTTRWPASWASPCRAPCCCRTSNIRPAQPIAPCAISSYPLDWDGIFEYVGFPAFLKPFDGGGWRDVYHVHNREQFFQAYDQTGDLCMTLQSAVKFQEYFRCYVIGQKKVHIMPYDPRRPFHERYVKDPPAYAPELLSARRARRAYAVPRPGL